MKDRRKKVERKIKGLLYWWTCKIEGDQPIQFSDELAFVLFSDSLYKAMWQMYKIGRKDERRFRKQKQTIKYLRRKS